MICMLEWGCEDGSWVIRLYDEMIPSGLLLLVSSGR